MLYAILDENLKFVEWREFDKFPVSKPGRVLPQVVDGLPVFDAATQRVGEGIPVVSSTEVRKTWVVVPLTPIEIQELQDVLLYNQAKAVFIDLRDGVGTQIQRTTRMEKILVWLLTRLARREKGELLS